MEAPAGPYPDQSRGSGTALGLETVELERLGKRNIDVKKKKTIVNTAVLGKGEGHHAN